MTQRPTLQQAFDAQIQNLATVLRPTSIQSYRERAKRFLAYIEAEHPGVGKVSQLRRHPHILGWLRSLYEHQPPLANKTRIDAIISVRRLLNDLAAVSRQPSRKTLFERGDLPRPISTCPSRFLLKMTCGYSNNCSGETRSARRLCC